MMTYTKVVNNADDETVVGSPPVPSLPDTGISTMTTTTTPIIHPSMLSEQPQDLQEQKPTTKRRTSGVAIVFDDDDDEEEEEEEDIIPPSIMKDQYAAVKRDCFVDDDNNPDESDHSNDHDIHKKSSSTTNFGLGAYWNLLVKYPMYRAYLVSHFCQNLGDWFVRIASILVVQEFSNTGQTIANLTLSVLIPKAIFSQIGGVIADRYDRRVGMIILDCFSGIVVLGYLLAIDYKSLPLMYTVTILRSTLGATYYPISTGLCPLLFPNATHDLQLAVTLNTFAWGFTSILGGLVAGALTAHIGFVTCYWVDCITFFTSAAWMYWGTSGNFSVAAEQQDGGGGDYSLTLSNSSSNPNTNNNTNNKTTTTTELEPSFPDDAACEVPQPTKGTTEHSSEHHITTNHPQTLEVSSTSTTATATATATCESQTQNILISVVDNLIQVSRYLWICGFGMLVFQKASASFIWGIEDIVGAKFTTVFGENGTEQEGTSSWHMGCLFSAIGAGCMVGPALVTAVTDARYPHTLQRACWIAYCLLTLGWILIGTLAYGDHAFILFLFFTFVRTMGSGIAWVNSTLVLQTLVEPTILGRVLAVENTLMTLTEATSAAMSGKLYDAAGFNQNQLALFGAFLGILMIVWWGVYYWIIKGAAANPELSLSTTSSFTTTTMVKRTSSITIESSTEGEDDLEENIHHHPAEEEEMTMDHQTYCRHRVHKELEVELELPEIA